MDHAAAKEDATHGYDASFTLRRARSLYFEDNAFGDDGGYTKKWVPVQIGPARIAIPNTAGRVRSVRLHDLHHIVTGYPTTLRGEAMMGAWELGSGCADHYAAWYLNANAFAYGMVLGPRALWRAFARGRRSKNLYGRPFDEAILERTVGELREELLPDGDAAPGARDALAFGAWLLPGFYFLAWNLLSIPLALVVGFFTRGRVAAR